MGCCAAKEPPSPPRADEYVIELQAPTSCASSASARESSVFTESGGTTPDRHTSATDTPNSDSMAAHSAAHRRSTVAASGGAGDGMDAMFGFGDSTRAAAPPTAGATDGDDTTASAPLEGDSRTSDGPLPHVPEC